MKPKPLQRTLLIAIVAVSFIAIIISTICFTLMLDSVKNNSLERGKQTTDQLINLVMDGFVQGEGDRLELVFSHVILMLEDQSFADDEALLRYAAGECKRIWGDSYIAPHKLFIARGGQVTAAVDIEKVTGTQSAMSAGEMTQVLTESGLMAAAFPDRTLTLEEMLDPFHSGGCLYDLQNENLPMLGTVSIGERDVLGLFYPQAASRPIFGALRNFSDLAHTETAATINEVVNQYILILAFVGVAMLTAIGLLARRLSRAIAAPVEREKELLEQVNRLKTEFLGNVSHELKTPLTVMSGYAQYSQKTLAGVPEMEEVEKRMKLITSEADRLALMVTQILDVTKIEEGRMTVDPRPAPIVGVIQRTLNTYYPVFAKNNNKLKIERSGEIPNVLCDTGRVSQVLVNLISNAAKHTRDGLITVSAEAEASFAVVNVTDNGEGIAPERLPFLFERFKSHDSGDEKARAGNQSPRGIEDSVGYRDTGTGLGLYICKHIIDAHGGEITIDSVIGEGTTVRFTLPLET